jgi:N-methylhydantoinase A
MSNNGQGAVQVAVDIGGTFTDVVLLASSGSPQKAKILSSPPNYGRAVIDGLKVVLKGQGIPASAISTLFHGMTVATNAVLEGRGSPTALVTTKGFRDSLELARGRRPTMYDLMWEKPKPLVPRRHRFEIDQRITATGELDPPVTEAAVQQVAERLGTAEVESVAVSLINSFMRPDEEQALTNALRKRLPRLLFTASVDIAPEIGEYERTSTAVVNAYIMPTVDSYLKLLEADLQSLGMDAPFYVMQSSGGLSRSADARRRPVHLIESGPAAGVMATRALAREIGIKNAIAFDMGGTTAKASLIENGEAFEASEYEVGAGMNAKRGLNVGAGHTVLTPTLDIAEVGAGGGSIFWIDAGGAPRVGPHSAGASPGPACYGAGGELPTLSDAALVLGYLNPVSIAGGTQSLRPDLAESALAKVAGPLGLSVVDAAYGAYQIAVANMTRLLKAVTSERGRDPRDSVLVAFGGAGPAYAGALARELGMTRVIVPVAPGLFSAVGLLVSDPQHDDVRAYLREAIDAELVTKHIDDMERDMVSRLIADGYARDQIHLSRFADMRYSGQKGILRIPVPSGPLSGAVLESLLDRLDDEHFRTYGHHKARHAARIANLRVRAICATERLNPLRALSAAERQPAPGRSGRRTSRDAYFGPEFGRIDTPIVARMELDGTPRMGPLIVEEMDSTTIIPPDVTAQLDELSNLIITVK